MNLPPCFKLLLSSISLEVICILLLKCACVVPLLQGLSFSDVMFVTKKNMANAVASVSKQLDSLTDALAVSIISCWPSY